MGLWLFKSEPSEYSYADLERDGETEWDGVTNPLALRYLSQVRRGDQIYLYHTGREKAVVGILEAVADAQGDPGAAAGRRWMVRVRPLRRLEQPVPLSRIKADPACAAWELVRLGRLSVMPVPPPIWEKIARWASSPSAEKGRG
ncbi:MAG: EVE domain-containing protein [Thermogemmata sp.]|mgnify:CR=1 FL=1|uniref:EVE domain-containing protein n=1 Tax=Thermogemmata fonticola TaxID=2755323 RepID=A0A7V9AC06_9BACT|nr:EVE domain-containing protein [Thermogemmata fonticola]MBA2226623.1 EVE domain-containing protein [Thermogemmata fonticola]MCX8140047.1 EVE domain-containing protein [Gemmataceae bacterium]